MISSQILCMLMITVDAHHTHETDRVAAQVLRAIEWDFRTCWSQRLLSQLVCFPKWISPDPSLPKAEREGGEGKDTRSKSAAGHGRGPAQHTAPASN